MSHKEKTKQIHSTCFDSRLESSNLNKRMREPKIDLTDRFLAGDWVNAAETLWRPNQFSYQDVLDCKTSQAQCNSLQAVNIPYYVHYDSDNYK